MCSTVGFDYYKYQQLAPKQIAENISQILRKFGQGDLYFSYETKLEYMNVRTVKRYDTFKVKNAVVHLYKG
jgi:hypothetical protein